MSVFMGGHTKRLLIKSRAALTPGCEKELKILNTSLRKQIALRSAEIIGDNVSRTRYISNIGRILSNKINIPTLSRCHLISTKSHAWTLLISDNFEFLAFQEILKMFYSHVY